MSDSEEQLYYACMEFCKSFFNLLCEKTKMRTEYWDDYEREKRMRFAKEMVDSDYNNLFNAIENFENDKQGVIGENQYRLELKKVKK